MSRVNKWMTNFMSDALELKLKVLCECLKDTHERNYEIV